MGLNVLKRLTRITGNLNYHYKEIKMAEKGYRQKVVENCVTSLDYWHKNARDDKQFTEMAYRVVNAAYEAAQKITKIDKGE